MNINTKIDQLSVDSAKHFRFLNTNNSSYAFALVLILVGLVAPMGAINTAQADTLYKTGFENPPFVNGGPLLGVDGWSLAIPPFLNPDAATITNTKAKSGKQSVEVHGADLIGSEGITAPYDAIGSYRRPLGDGDAGFTFSPTKSLARVDTNLRLETNQLKTPGEFFSLTIAARSGDGETLGEVGLSSQGIVEAFGFDTAPGSAPVFTKPIIFNKWYHITMLLDSTNRTTAYFIDGHFLGAVPAPSASNILLRGSMVVYARPDGDVSGGASSSRNDYTAFFDNFRISVHNSKNAPEID